MRLEFQYNTNSVGAELFWARTARQNGTMAGPNDGRTWQNMAEVLAIISSMYFDHNSISR
jgi:hypothetical protein